MDLKSLKEKAIEIKNKATDKTKKAVNYSKEKISGVKTKVTNKDDLDFLIKKSASTSFKNKETGEEKIYKHKSIAIFVEEGSDFMKKAIYIMPIFSAKAYSQNIYLKLANSEIEGVNLSDYEVNKDNLPCLVVFEEEKVYKIIEGQENILKLVKSFDLDINKLIDNV